MQGVRTSIANEAVRAPLAGGAAVAPPRSNGQAIFEGEGGGAHDSEAAFREMANQVPIMVWITGPDGACTFLSDSWLRFTGQTLEEGLGLGWIDAVHPEDRPKAKAEFLEAVAREGPFRVEYRLRRHDGDYRWAIDAASPRRNRRGEFTGYIGSVIDITDRRKAERLESGQREVLELIVKDAPLASIFEALVRMVEEQSPSKVLASVLVLDREGRRLLLGAAPGLPESYNSAIHGLEIGAEVGSCGTAAFHKRPVYVADIENSPLWAGFSKLALAHGLRACWSTPILSSTGAVLGTFALYYQHVREPMPEDLKVVEVATRTASIAIERKQAQEALSLREQHLRAIIENTPECVKVVDGEGRLLQMNAAGLRLIEADCFGSVNGVCVYDIIAPEHREAFKAMNERVCAGSHERLQFEIVGLNGARRWMETRAVPVRDPASGRTAQLAITWDITRRRETELALKEQLELTRTVAENSTQAIFMMNAEGLCTYMNRAAEKMTGYTLAEAQAARLHDLIHHHRPDGRPYPMSECPIDRALPENFAIREHEDVFIRKSGEFFPVLVSASPVFKDGRPVSTVVEVRDVSETKRAAEALRLSRERLDLVIDASKVGVWFCDLPLEVLEWDARVKEHFWIETEAKVTLDLFFERIHPDDRNKVRLAIDAAIHKRAAYDVEYRTVSPAGQQRWVRAIGKAFTDSEGRPSRFDGVTIDITENMRRELEIAEAAERLRFMAESMPQKIFTASPRGEIDYVNRQWTEFTGRPAKALLGQGWVQVIHPEDAAETARRWRHSVDSGQSFQMEHRMQGADGACRWHLTRAHAMRDHEGRVVTWIGSNTDIDDQKRAEALLEQTVSERTAKLKEIIGDLEAFSYSVSHDLRSPLRAMQGYTQELLKAAPQLSAAHRTYLERIHRAASRLDRLTQDVLAYSRLANAEISLQRIDPARVAREIVEQYPHLSESGAEIVIESPMPEVMGNEAFLTQALSNLMNNGVKFVPKDRMPRVVVRAADQGATVRIIVEDNGIGIEPRHYNRLFQIFGRVHPDSKFEGTGIGLAIVKKTVERMKGSAGFESEPQQGSKFWIELPKPGGDNPDRNRTRA